MSPLNSPRRYLLYANQDYSFPILRPIQDAIRQRGDLAAWFVHGNAHPENYLQDTDQLCTNLSEAFDFNPMAVITPQNTLPHFLPGIKTQVFHGFNARKRSNGGVDSHFAIRGFFDLYCTHGPSTTQVFQQLSHEHPHFRVTETGWPKMDSLFKQAVDHKPRHRPTIILTSTFTKNLSCALPLLPVIKQLVARNDMDWMVQFHPKMSASTVAEYKAIQADNYQFIETSNVLPWLAKADVMVCDTSSILQEFLQLERPVVTLRNRTPGPWLIDIQNPEELMDAIQKALTRPASLIEAIRNYNAQLHPYTDGLSSERVLQAIDQYSAQNSPTLSSKPLNLIRKFKMRKELSYWRLRPPGREKA
ncbi:CDP-glycerol glycerophosphotransferase family protein [Granulosicoccus antarcticus]|uniref:UDP-N-acetylglucosamine 2-epimerase domain-containing protein n=1 Tax=Granulosicoccus antarcticus IMCC3135 TaxID=1192854 RepID=A0A2Z2NT86_9GAMM|nr:CDP-glycerol glycerophosphotransferase family protein [Granulosicoccus antarcticus]ASJ70817.1 hypothetical protein IMCC3135_03520 [Granulosicoccus antarcticus IMCC3135]